MIKKQKEAEAFYIYKQKEAAGIFEIFNAQAEGLTKLMQISPDPNVVLQYMMIDKDMYTKLAAENAKAIQGLEPKITHWVTDGGSGSNGSNPLKDIMMNLPPLVDTIHRQTGLLPPAWLLNTDQLKNKQ